MMKMIAVALMAVLAVGCGKKEESKPAEPTAETKPAETKPADKPADPPAEEKKVDGVAAIPIPQAKATDPQVLTGGQPTPEHFATAKEVGVKTVVNLRAEGEKAEGYPEEEAKLGEMGVKYVHIPIDGKTGEGLNEENAKKLAELLSGEKPMIVHCASGQRVGALYALKAFYVDKKSPEESLQIGRDNGLSKPELEKIVSDQMAAKKPT